MDRFLQGSGKLGAGCGKPSALVSWSFIVFVPLLALAASPVHSDSSPSPSDLTHLGIEDLMNLEVVSTAKQAQRVADAAAAVFVITQDDIRRSGATSIPEALRMVPGVEAAQIDSAKWAISIRGFNGRFASKLLVMVNGRSIYTPIFSGVYWEIQDLLLEDIERIEVIRGPGASLWGANAVNGIINIITKHAADTQGGMVSLTAGNQHQPILGVRYGGQLGDNGHYRVYGKYLNEGPLVDNEGKDAGDNWRLGSGGFRVDWAPSSTNAFNLQGDTYTGDLNQNLTAPSLFPPFAQHLKDTTQTSGGNVQAQWQHTLSPTSQLSLQTYYQWEQRQEALQDEQLDIFDLDFQHSFALGERQKLIWGLDYRLYSDDFKDTLLSSFSPSSRRYDLLSGFFQDQVSLFSDRLNFTFGVKLERNDFTGWEFQPSARLLWTPNSWQRVWAAIARAVRTPSRGERDSTVNLFAAPPLAPQLPPSLFTISGPDFDSEKLLAYELGYRVWPSDRLSLDMAAFYNDYDDERGAAPGLPFLAGSPEGYHLTVPLLIDNVGTGHSYGFELAAEWRPLDRWRLQLAYSYFHSNLTLAFPNNPVSFSNETTPQNQLSLRSAFDLRDDLELDLWLRYTDEIPIINTLSPLDSVSIDPYLTLNLRLGWRPRRDLEFALIGANLLDAKHLEYVPEAFPFPTQVERSLYGQLRWSF
jgi:iron complex outermembrane receptor protein